MSSTPIGTGVENENDNSISRLSGFGYTQLLKKGQKFPALKKIYVTTVVNKRFAPMNSHVYEPLSHHLAVLRGRDKRPEYPHIAAVGTHSTMPCA